MSRRCIAPITMAVKREPVRSRWVVAIMVRWFSLDEFQQRTMQAAQEDEGQANGGEDGGAGKLKPSLSAAQARAAGEARLSSRSPFGLEDRQPNRQPEAELG